MDHLRLLCTEAKDIGEKLKDCLERHELHETEPWGVLHNMATRLRTTSVDNPILVCLAIQRGALGFGGRMSECGPQEAIDGLAPILVEFGRVFSAMHEMLVSDALKAEAEFIKAKLETPPPVLTHEPIREYVFQDMVFVEWIGGDRARNKPRHPRR